MIALVAITGAVIATLFAVSLLDDEGSAGPSLGVTLADVAADPEAYAGRRVIVSGEVGARLTDRAFVIGSEQLLVVDTAERTPGEGVIAQVDGIVRHGPIDDLASELDLALDEAALDRLGEDPVTAVVADALVLNPMGEGLADGAAFESVDAGEDVLALTEFQSQFDSLQGQTVTVAGEVGIAYATHVSSLSGIAYNTGDVILVSRDAAVGGFLNLISARVTGTATTFDPAAIEAEHNIDLENELVDQFTGEPAIVVESVHFFPRQPRLGAALLDLIGRRVTARGTISTVYSEQLFALEDDDVLVMSAEPVSGLVPEALAVVTGTAGAFDTEALTPEHHDMLGALTTDQIEDYQGHAVVVVEAVTIVP